MSARHIDLPFFNAFNFPQILAFQIANNVRSKMLCWSDKAAKVKSEKRRGQTTKSCSFRTETFFPHFFYFCVECWWLFDAPMSFFFNSINNLNSNEWTTRASEQCKRYSFRNLATIFRSVFTYLRNDENSFGWQLKLSVITFDKNNGKAENAGFF